MHWIDMILQSLNILQIPRIEIAKIIAFTGIIFLVFYAFSLSPLCRQLTAPINKKITQKKNSSFKVGLILSILVACTYSFLVFNRTFPMAEGWYTLFSKYISIGKQPYKDFEFLYTPFYVYLISFITKIFGYDIIVLRIFGAFLFGALCAVCYLLYARIFSPWISTPAACISVFYMQSEVAQIFYDYIRIYDLLNILTCYFFLAYVQETLKEIQTPPRRRKSSILAGLFAGISILSRQNSGLIVTAFCLVFILFLTLFTQETKKQLKDGLFFALSAISPFLLVSIFLLKENMFSSYIDMTTTGALSSKGGISAVLFGWIPRAIPMILRESLNILLLGGLFTINYLLYKKKKRNHFSENNMLNILFSLFSMAIIIVMFYSNRVTVLFISAFQNRISPYSLFVLGLCIFLAAFAYSLKKRKLVKKEHIHFILSVLTVSGFYLATAYGSATSAGFSEGQSALAIGLFFALLLYFSQHKFHREAVALSLSLVLLFTVSTAGKKMNLPYSWWGLSEQPIVKATETIDAPLMNGIRVSPSRKRSIERIYQDIVNHSTKEDFVFIFPHIPIFYVMADRYPDTFSLVQWFDVSTDATIEQDRIFLENNPPEVLVICKLPDAAVEGHENLFKAGKPSEQRKMMDSLFQLSLDHNYDFIGRYRLGGDYDVYVYANPK